MPRETVGRAGGGGPEKGGHPGHRRHRPDRHLPEGVRRPGIEAAAPPPEVQKLVMSIIYDEIKRGEKGSREKFAVIDKWLRAAGCGGGHPGLHRAVRLSHLPRPARLLPGRHGRAGGEVHHRLRLQAADGVAALRTLGRRAQVEPGPESGQKDGLLLHIPCNFGHVLVRFSCTACFGGRACIKAPYWADARVRFSSYSGSSVSRCSRM